MFSLTVYYRKDPTLTIQFVTWGECEAHYLAHMHEWAAQAATAWEITPPAEPPHYRARLAFAPVAQ